MLRGKSAVVTGSTSGIGLGIARALAAQHAHIMLNGFGESTAIDALITDLRAQYGVEVDYSSADLSRPEQVIGSTVRTRFETHDGHSELVKLAEVEAFNDRHMKVRNIGLHIGRRPLLAFGNSDSDMAMLHYTRTGKGRRLAMLLHHDDAKREHAYDREFRISPLIEGLNRRDELHFELVSMERDWHTIFPAPRD